MLWPCCTHFLGPVADPDDLCPDLDPTIRSGSESLKKLFILNSRFFLTVCMSILDVLKNLPLPYL